MKTALSVTLTAALAALGLAGCVAVPVPVAPRPAYVAPPPPVVVVPRPYYYGPRWHRHRYY